MPGDPGSYAVGIAVAAITIACLLMWNWRLRRVLRPLKSVDDVNRAIDTVQGRQTRQALRLVQYRMMLAAERGDVDSKLPVDYAGEIGHDWERLAAGTLWGPFSVALYALTAVFLLATSVVVWRDDLGLGVLVLLCALIVSGVALAWLQSVRGVNGKVGRLVLGSLGLSASARQAAMAEAVSIESRNR